MNDAFVPGTAADFRHPPPAEPRLVQARSTPTRFDPGRRIGHISGIMYTTPKRPWWALLLMALSLATLSGCVYLRLLEVKSQLADFNRHFQVHFDPRPRVVCADPVLLARDADKLLKLAPTSVGREAEHLVYTYHFVKRKHDLSGEDGAFDMDLVLRFHDDKLQEIEFPEKFTEFMSAEALDKLFRRMDAARVDSVSKRASWLAPELAEHLAREEDILRFLGQPTQSGAADGLLAMTYVYDLHGDEATQEAARFELTVNEDQDYVVRSDIRLGGLHFDVQFDMPANHVTTPRSEKAGP